MIIKLNHAVQKDLFKLAIIVFNVPHQMFSIQLIKDADHVQLITFITIQQENVIVKFHVLHQDNLMRTIFVNVQMQKPGTNKAKFVNAHQIFHSGMGKLVLNVHKEHNSIQKKINAITAQRDSSEIQAVTHVFQDSDKLRFILF